MRIGLAQQRSRKHQVRWVFPLATAVLLWIIACVVVGRISVGVLLDNVTLASFVGLAAVAQMLVIATGEGSFDLSIPYIMVLAAFVSGAASGGADKYLIVAVIAGLAAGVGAGVFNGALVVGLGLPPIVATLATGYIAYTVVLLMGGGAQLAIAPALVCVSHRSWEGLTLAVPVAVVIWAGVAVLRGQGRYGVYLHAMGQSRAAAALAGVPVKRMVVWTFVLSGTLAAAAGILLSGYVGGAFPDMGDPYLIGSVAAVVVGGTSVSGGESAIAATVFGALTMALLVAVLELSGAGANVQDIAEGTLIIAVVLAVRHGSGRR